DVDRGDFPHFFRKEIEQSPDSVARTLRGKFDLEQDGRRLVLNLGEEILPGSLEQRLVDGSIRRIVCAGQGTASVAAGAIAALLREDLADAPVLVRSDKASELSGFGLREDMSDTLVIAVTQSGSTADTNRAVDLSRRRGASVIAVVNRRNSDITRRADGVFYTSDGRDVEMSVASTKAFHAQVAAGAVLSLALARSLGVLDDATAAERAAQLRSLPDLLRSVLACDDRIAEVAGEHAPTRRHWAIIGSGWNRIAAEEVRIKCSELCYKSISADTVEDKKHIDLSAESLMLVLASGNPGTVQGDLAKDVAIFQAHKALPIVFADEGDERYDPYASAVVALPAAPPRLAMLVNVMAGHLFAYHSARSIDEGARFLAGVRSVVRGVFEGEGGVRTGTREAEDAAAETVRRLRAGRFDAALEPRIAGTLPLLLHAATDALSPQALESLGVESGLRDETVLARLTEAVRELERPVDAIRHQAKIVTVGTSRTVERPEGPVFDALDEAGVELDAVPETSLSTVRAVAPALAEVEGWARYRVEELGADGMPKDETLHVIEARGGVSAQLPSRAEGGAPLKGTKRGVVRTRRAFVGVGGKDGRTLLIVPLVDARLHCTALVLMHIRFRDDMSVEEKIRALGPRGLQQIVDGVTEADIPWTDTLLEGLSPADLFSRPSTQVVLAIMEAQGG
ncbi:MAG: SIS domain-containing protein, partial [Planctomycetota bacterium]